MDFTCWNRLTFSVIFLCMLVSLYVYFRTRPHCAHLCRSDWILKLQQWSRTDKCCADLVGHEVRWSKCRCVTFGQVYEVYILSIVVKLCMVSLNWMRIETESFYRLVIVWLCVGCYCLWLCFFMILINKARRSRASIHLLPTLLFCVIIMRFGFTLSVGAWLIFFYMT